LDTDICRLHAPV